MESNRKDSWEQRVTKDLEVPVEIQSLLSRISNIETAKLKEGVSEARFEFEGVPFAVNVGQAEGGTYYEPRFYTDGKWVALKGEDEMKFVQKFSKAVSFILGREQQLDKAFAKDRDAAEEENKKREADPEYFEAVDKIRDLLD